MAASPPFKIYRDNEYVASCKYGEDAAALVSVSGGEVRFGHSLVVWREGSEDVPAGESYDGAASIMFLRIQEHNKEAFEKTYGKGAAAQNI